MAVVSTDHRDTGKSLAGWLALLGLALVLLLGGAFRYTGLMWGDYEYPHPDERFLVWVVSDIAPVESLGEYFNTETSTLNPANRGHGFYVYGDLPVIATRYLTEWDFEQVGWAEILQAGRGLSAFLDLLTVLLVFLIAYRLADWRIATLAGAFNALAVLQIQQSHFFTTDTFSTFFTTLAVYLAVLIATRPAHARRGGLLALNLFFGLAVGLAMACKINTAPVALLLPAALFLHWARLPRPERAHGPFVLRLVGMVVLSGVLAFLVFRVGQPYAFSGPGFFDVMPDERWLQSINDLRAQSAGDVDFPPALQWARRPPWFSLQNLVLWGLGAPLALAGWLGFFLLAWRGLRQVTHRNAAAAVPAWPGALIVWAWTAFYFTWQALAWNPTMRYQLPVYPMLCVLAAWGLGELWRTRRRRPARVAVSVAGALVLLLTLAWAFAFSRIYTRPETRVAASRWIFDNVPAPVNLIGSAGGQPWTQLAGAPGMAVVRPGQPYFLLFDARQSGALDGLQIAALNLSGFSGQGELRLRARIYDPAAPDQTLASAEAALPGENRLENFLLPALAPERLEAGRRYGLALELTGPENDALPEDMGISASLEGTLALNLYAESQSATYQEGPSALVLPEDGMLRQLRLPRDSGLLSALVTLSSVGEGTVQSANASRLDASTTAVLMLDTPLEVKAGVNYVISIQPVSGAPLQPGGTLQLDFLDQPASLLLPGVTPLARSPDPLWVPFTARQGGTLDSVMLGNAAQVDPTAGISSLTLEIYRNGAPGAPLASARLNLPDLPAGDNPRGPALTFAFDPPLALEQGQQYSLMLAPEQGALAVRGSAVVNETSWDMGLPFRMEPYDPFGGLYRGDLNFEMYWDDNPEKLQRFLNNLDQGDYVFFSSNRQWGTTTRVPERYPLTTQFYRSLLGCPPEREVTWCYNVAEPGMFQGELGFELVAVFTSYPNLGPVRINDQFAEEAFTVYDHPKVMIFQKRADYTSAQARAVLGAVDLERVERLTPKKAADYTNLLLPGWRWAVQQAGGSWARLFPPEGLLNRWPWLALAAFYGFFLLFGALMYPLVRLALPNLPDRGYPVARTAGLLLLAYLPWLLGSLAVPVTRGLLLAVFLLLAAAGIYAGWRQRAALRAEWVERRADFLRVEALALGLFLLAALIRLGNPDLWHPIFGGEKPMDLSYWTAVMKSSTFPPYDPWFAGGYINYYYYGFVLVGMPVKLLGIQPSIAYNLVMPLLFMLAGLGAYSAGWNLLRSARPNRHSAALAGGLAAVGLLLLLGNLGTPRMLWQGWQRVIVSEEEMRAGNIIQHAGWAAQGIARLVSDPQAEMPYYLGDWYWKPSRAIQPEAGNEITEFPFFTFLYGDLHAHFIALPVTLLVVVWAINALLALPGRRRWWAWLPCLTLGALAVGSLRPTNTWDQYTYLALAALAIFYGQWRALEHRRGPIRALSGLLPALALAILALLLYRPFDAWFEQGYNSLVLWEHEKTGLPSYLAHWGLFLWIITAWVFDETVDWMDHTPVSALGGLARYRPGLIALGVGVLLVLAALLLRGVSIALLAVPLGVWVTALLMRPNLPAAKRAVLFLVGTALALHLAVEVVAVKGDIGRMNTVFKFYYQSWTLLAVSAGAALAWLWPKVTGLWRPAWRGIWTGGLALLVVGAALYPIMATRARVVDRMEQAAPRTLDGMTYMDYARYTDGDDDGPFVEMDLRQDADAIRWMQANVPGSPVIVEAHTPEYRHWGTRFTIYTGLPGVVGWNWHQRQQRTVTPDSWVWDRVNAVGDFYRTEDPEQAQQFLRRYNVQYIILGQLERIWYAGLGLNKFSALEGVLWDKVYEQGETVIYRVK